MSKKLNSILDKLPHATASDTPDTIKKISHNKLNDDNEEKIVRIVAPVPLSLKTELRRYILDNPEETEKSLILKGLRLLGFHIDDKYIEDKRKFK
ncbi:MAG: hypothetical protein AAF549_09255 [Pseudomonadota bacterium]